MEAVVVNASTTDAAKSHKEATNTRDVIMVLFMGVGETEGLNVT